MKIWRVSISARWLFAALLLSSVDGRAASAGQWMNRATHIAVVTVVRGRLIADAPHRACSFEYEIGIERDFRNASSIRRILTDAQLKLGGEYLLVVADTAPWAAREFATDVPIPPSETEEPRACATHMRGAWIVRSAELRPIRAGGLPAVPPASLLSNLWVAFPPSVLSSSRSLTRVSDVDRVALADHRIGWPPVEMSEYFLLQHLIGLLRESPEHSSGRSQ